MFPSMIYQDARGMLDQPSGAFRAPDPSCVPGTSLGGTWETDLGSHWISQATVTSTAVPHLPFY